MKIINTFFNVERKIVDVAAILLIAALSILVIVQVFARYMFNHSITWSEELARYLQVWLVMMGSVILTRKKGHLAIDIVTASLPPKVRYVTEIIVHITVLVFFAIVAYYGVTLTANAARQLSPALRLHMSYVYAALPVGGALIFLEEFRLFVEHLLHGWPKAGSKGVDSKAVKEA
ncbi:TRAP transporter small permease [Pseudoflavonifractor sp. AF19-9AC]|uniref:TRAP transporter small permease n=1 Tax=Pseudoflavonifractor sp. AF19-9AC TaxID=2292244 RepID=UPI001314C2E9|nr:TRAP transporter small permease [Pseudoflavonifractor sp. AF19-9AC]